MKLIVGLGNPGKEYENTRHNTGFMAIDEYAKINNIDFNKNKFDGLYTDILVNNEKVILLKPQKYMNLSGEVIYKYMDYFKIKKEDILIIYDDMDLDVGTFKIRFKGGSAGHNGLKNIESNISSNEYKRIKIGISKNKNIDTVNYVLGKFSKEEKEKLNEVLKNIPNIIDDYLKLDFDKLMNKYN
ncbi:MAG: aminoacyl-tRNA hydrolase [Firmicutes bacterium]|nr:aminoacyl-tRNA hydrolase [Bacillota bacterium]